VTCQEVCERLSAWRDDEAAGSARLSRDERRAVKQHLDECAACREALAAIDRTASRVRRLPAIEAPWPATARALALGQKHADELSSEEKDVVAVKYATGAAAPVVRAAAAASAPAPAPAEYLSARRSPVPNVLLVVGLLALLALIAYALGFRF
jgi:anti-sigma factor RsiW